MIESSYKVHTYGCKVNTYDSGLLQKRLDETGLYTPSDSPAVHILNSCAVTQEATREALRQARRIKKKDPEATVVLTGCAAQVDGHWTDAESAVDLVVANSHKGDLEEILQQYFRGEVEQKVFRSNIFRNEKLGVGGGEEAEHTRSFLKIQDGCNSFCTFCIIPYARGKSRSIPVPLLVHKINQLSAQGVGEVVLTGVHIGDYVDEETPGGPFHLEGLLREVLLKTKIQRIRLTSLEPIELSEELLDIYSDPRMCRHFHMSIQSANSEILHKMKRKYDAEKVEWSLNEIQRRFSDAFVGMDVIAGFPGESETHFADTMNRLAGTPWTRIHVFPYSERRGTRAPLLEGAVPIHLRKERAKKMRELSAARYDGLAIEQVGREKKVLLLNGGPYQKVQGQVVQRQQIRGLSRDYWDVAIVDEPGAGLVKSDPREIDVKIIGYHREQNGAVKGYLTASRIEKRVQHG